MKSPCLFQNPLLDLYCLEYGASVVLHMEDLFEAKAEAISCEYTAFSGTGRCFR